MTGNNDRDTVGIVGLSHRPKCRRLADRPRKIAVGTGFPERYLQKRIPDTTFELRAPAMERHPKLELLSGEIGFEFFRKLFERVATARNEMSIQLALKLRHGVAPRLLVMEFDGNKMRLAGDGKDRADRCFEPFCKQADLFHRNVSRLFALAFISAAVHNPGMPHLKTLPDPADFAHVTEWVFDLDNTLYPHHINLFAQIDTNMTAFVAELLQMEPAEAKLLQKKYYHEHGTTLKGLMLNHAVDPAAFLERAHAIDYSLLQPQPDLGEAIKALPGRKFILTNGTVPHAEAAAGAMGILDQFDDIFDIVAADYLPKPASATYDKFAALNKVDTKNAAMFEDLPRNLIAPKAMGMRTVLLAPEVTADIVIERWEKISDEDVHIDYLTQDLIGFLQAILKK